MDINPNTTSIAELALEVPSALRALDDLKIDFCCYSERTIAEACADAGIAVEDLFEAIGGELFGAGRDWRLEPMAVLQEHLVGGHHVYTRATLETVSLLAARVADRHGVNHPEVLRVREMVATLQEDLLRHMTVEEQIVFPYLHRLEAAVADGGDARFAPPEAVDRALRAISADHDLAAARLLEIRRETSDYALPADACLSYRALYERLEGLEKDLGEHMQLENAFIFSRAGVQPQGRSGGDAR